MRKYITLIFALALMSLGLNAQSGRGSGLSGTGLDGFIEQTQFDSLHVDPGTFVYGVAGSGQEVTATGVELNYLDITLGTGDSSKAVVLDANGAYIWPAGAVFTYGVLNDGTNAITATAAQINYLDLAGATGISEANKAVVLDGSSQIDALDIIALSLGGDAITVSASDINNFVSTNSSGIELDYLDLVSLGTGDSSKAVVLDINGAYIWPAGAVFTYGVLNDGIDDITATAAEINYVDVSPGTSASDKAVVLDASSQIDALDIIALSLNGTAVNATAAEIDRIADKTASIVEVTGASVSIDLLTHGDRIIVLSRASGITVTLPLATGTGATYTFIIGIGCTSGDYIIQVGDASDDFDGGLAIGVDIDAEGASGYTWFAEAGDDTFTMPADGKSGGEVGDRIILTDYATDSWMIDAHIQQGGGAEATPFSSNVP